MSEPVRMFSFAGCFQSYKLFIVFPPDSCTSVCLSKKNILSESQQGPYSLHVYSALFLTRTIEEKGTIQDTDIHQQFSRAFRRNGGGLPSIVMWLFHPSVMFSCPATIVKLSFQVSLTFQRLVPDLSVLFYQLLWYLPWNLGPVIVKFLNTV